MSHWIVRTLSPPSNITAASGSVFTMFVRILPDATVAPGSSTSAAILCLIEMSRLVVWNSRTPSSAFIYMPERTGRVEFEAIPFATTERACMSADWLTVNFIRYPPLLLVLIYRKEVVVIIRLVEKLKSQNLRR